MSCHANEASLRVRNNTEFPASACDQISNVVVSFHYMYHGCLGAFANRKAHYQIALFLYLYIKSIFAGRGSGL